MKQPAHDEKSKKKKKNVRTIRQTHIYVAYTIYKNKLINRRNKQYTRDRFIQAPTYEMNIIMYLLSYRGTILDDFLYEPVL